MASLLERLAFLQKVPTLMRATADDDSPCPGYLFEEISKFSHESAGCSQCLLENLLERLQVESCHVKVKVLKILLHLCSHGPAHFLTELRRNATFIQEAIVYTGPSDPVHGNAHVQKVRSLAQDLASALFTETLCPEPKPPVNRPVASTMGMGSDSHRSGMQGFGNSPGRKESDGDSLLDKIQKAAEVVASAVLPPTEHPGIRLHDNHYHAVAAPSVPVEMAVPACAYNAPSARHPVHHRCPGQAGGGWEESDSGHSSSRDSTLDTAPVGRGSVDRSSKSAGSGSQSGASGESGDQSERAEAVQLSDCGQETALVHAITRGAKVFLCREESQHFLKECSTLNCEVIVELLSRKLPDPQQVVQMRALCALACLMASDFLALERIFNLTHTSLVHLSEGTTGPVASKATKLLRQFEALLGCSTNPKMASGEEAPSPGSSRSPAWPFSTAQAGRDSCLDDASAPEDAEPSRLSLFRGMELVNICDRVCSRDGSPAEETTSSAFSFLNL